MAALPEEACWCSIPAIAGIRLCPDDASWQLGPAFAMSHLISQADVTEESDSKITVNKLVNVARSRMEIVSTLNHLMRQQEQRLAS